MDNTPLIEKATSKRYRGVGQMHTVANSNRKTSSDAHYNFVVVKSAGRGHLKLMLTDEQIRDAEIRYTQNREDSPEPKTFWQIIWSGELWRLKN